MKTDELVQLAYDGVVVNFTDHTFALEVDYKESKIELWLPIYISTLGINRPENDYVLPGPTLDIKHPDYLEIIDSRKSLYRKNGITYKKELDRDFIRNGKYYLFPQVPYASSMQVITAQLRSQKERTAVLKLWKEKKTIISGASIQGRLMYIFVKTAQETKIVKYSPSMTETKSLNVLGLVEDDYTSFFWIVPIFLLTEI